MIGASRKTNGTSNGAFDDSVDADGKMTDADGKRIGTLSGDDVSGTFPDSNGVSVTITGKRTL